MVSIACLFLKVESNGFTKLWGIKTDILTLNSIALIRFVLGDRGHTPDTKSFNGFRTVSGKRCFFGLGQVRSKLIVNTCSPCSSSKMNEFPYIFLICKY